MADAAATRTRPRLKVKKKSPCGDWISPGLVTCSVLSLVFGQRCGQRCIGKIRATLACAALPNPLRQIAFAKQLWSHRCRHLSPSRTHASCMRTCVRACTHTRAIYHVRTHACVLHAYVRACVHHLHWTLLGHLHWTLLRGGEGRTDTHTDTVTQTRRHADT